MPWSPSAAWRFAAGGALAFAAAYALSEAVDPVYPELRARMALFRERSPGLQAVAVGNSHGAAIDFGEMGVRGMHLGMAGQDPSEAAYLARYAAAEAPGIRYVLFAASYGLQRRDHAVVGSSDARARRRQLYARTPLRRPIPGELDLWVAGKLAPVVRDDHWKGVIGRPVRSRPPVRLGQDGRLLAPERPRLGRDSLARHGAVVGAQHRMLGEETVALSPGTPTRVAARLDALARELGGRGVALVLYTPPYHESYLHAQDPTVNAEARAILERIVADNPNAVWLDYSTDPRFTGRDDLFTNSDHLNPAGGRAFSRLLRECLRFSRPEAAEAAEPPGCPAAEGPVASARPHAHPRTAAKEGQ